MTTTNTAALNAAHTTIGEIAAELDATPAEVSAALTAERLATLIAGDAELEHRDAELEPATAPAEPAADVDVTDRNTAIKLIRANLKARSGKTWSVTGGRGTAWGWITVTAPPARRVDFGYMTEADQRELGELLALGGPAHPQGVSIAASSNHRREYVARAEGKTPDVIGEQYWD